ncbi:MAG: PDZ domain-containing protein [Pirellulaceae bacterium]|nr:PDZ domain-containing protein [Pirellulaceae bacterium]
MTGTHLRPGCGTPRRRASTRRPVGLARLALTCLGATVLLGAGPPLGPPSPGGDEAVAAPTAKQIAGWVRELDDDQFVIRRRATEQLILAGQRAIDPVLAGIGSGNLEVATRGVHVLQALAASTDLATREAAVAALRQLVGSPSRSAARQATAAMAALSEVWQQQAIQELEDLGAEIDMTDQFLALMPHGGLSVTIGPQWQGGVSDLQRFRWLPDVQEVAFVGPRVTDEWIQAVEYLAGVERVTVKNAAITNGAVRTLSKLKQLTSVYLLYTPVNDDALEYLKAMPSLRDVRLYGTNVTRPGYDAFAAAAAQVQVEFKMGAFLGVQCQPAPLPCQVSQVVNDSAAMRGGIEARDIIVRYAGEPVATFDDLRRLISRNKVGDSVLIQVVRGGAPVVCALERRGNLPLGLEGEATPFGCRVRKLASDGAAAKSGVRVDDVIVELNGEPASTADQLQGQFTALAAESELTFGVLRNSRIVSLRVTFGEWTEDLR